MGSCPRCGRENEADVRFCGRCGLDLHEYAATNRTVVADESRCYRHPKVATALSCGRCERPICTRCAINGPAGIRCRECSRHKVAVRPGAIVHEARRSVSGVFRGGPWTIYALMALVSIGLGVTRGCGSQREPRPAAEVEASVSPEAEPVRSGESASPR